MANPTSRTGTPKRAPKSCGAARRRASVAAVKAKCRTLVANSRERASRDRVLERPLAKALRSDVALAMEVAEELILGLFATRFADNDFVEDPVQEEEEETDLTEGP